MTAKKFTPREAIVTFMALENMLQLNPQFAETVRAAQDKMMDNTRWGKRGRKKAKGDNIDVLRAKTVAIFEAESPGRTVAEYFNLGQCYARLGESILEADEREGIESGLTNENGKLSLTTLFPDTDDIDRLINLEQSVSRGRAKLKPSAPSSEQER